MKLRYNRKPLLELGKLILPEKRLLTSKQQDMKAACEQSLHTFMTYALPIMNIGRPFEDGWIMHALTEHLEAVYKRDIRNLLINMPPRCSKSMTMSCGFPAWVWTHDPGHRFLCCSYAHELALRDSVYCRRLITSEWYQSLWGAEFKLMDDVNNKRKFDNNKGGARFASSVGGVITGMEGDIQIIDDANNVKDIESQTTRDDTNDWFRAVMPLRIANPKTGCKIVTQQRTHVLDLSGYILATNPDGWVHLNLPMEFEAENRCHTVVLPSSAPEVWQDPRQDEGEIIWPERFPPEELEKIKAEFNYDSYIIAGQLQQRPSPLGGGIIKTDWFNLWTESELPRFTTIIQSWDTALTAGGDSCFSACTTWGIFEDDGGINNVMLLSLFSEKVEYPDLRKMAVRLSRNYRDIYMDDKDPSFRPVDLILIEAKVSGYCLFQDLLTANLPVMRFNPTKHGDKIGRVRIVSHLMENGLVWLPTKGPTFEFPNREAQQFLEAASMFPNDQSNDIIDSMSQAFMHIKHSGWLMNKEDPPFERDEAWKHNADKPFY